MSHALARHKSRGCAENWCDLVSQPVENAHGWADRLLVYMQRRL
jgi:hypothetical protein